MRETLIALTSRTVTTSVGGLTLFMSAYIGLTLIGLL